MFEKSKGFLEKQFELKEKETDAYVEIRAGITTFMTMSYILIINPRILSDAGMDWGGVFSATAISAGIASILMAFLANYPFVLAPGMGMNAVFTYSIVRNLGKSWEFALTAVLISGVIFLILSLWGLEKVLFKSIPKNIEKAISVGIGLFITLLGFSNSGLITQGNGTILTLGIIRSPRVLLTIIGLILISYLLIKKVEGAFLIGMLGITVLGIPLGVTQVPEYLFEGYLSMREVAFQFKWDEVLTFDMFFVVMTFLFTDILDTAGTLIGVTSRIDILDDDGKLPRVKSALIADSVGTIVGACLGTSTVTTYVESTSGVLDGGRTGLTALSAGIMFLLSIFLSPIFSMVPAAATSPVLILVGLFMMDPIKDIDFKDITESIPAFLTMVIMPFSYSIADGIMVGMVSYVLLKVLAKRQDEIPKLMYLVVVIFILKIAFI